MIRVSAFADEISPLYLIRRILSSADKYLIPMLMRHYVRGWATCM